jgi:hypothetical protein
LRDDGTAEQDYLTTMYSADYSLSQTAPLVGRHDKVTTSLLGFDPLLKGTTKNLKQDKGKPTLSIIGVSSVLSAEERDQTHSPNASSAELQSELRALASELGKLSPAKPHGQSQKKSDDEKGHWKNPLRGFLSPQVPSKGKAKAQGKHHHRRVKSLGSYEEKTVTKDRGISPPPLAENQVPLSSSMMQELWEVHQSSSRVSANDPLEALALPSLVKPRPTSFLTGTEVQITSEIDATGWQVEIPPKEEFEFTARVSLFLEHYRREECLLDLQLLVGCSYHDLAHFSSGRLSLATEKIAKFHRPIVESLLECGGDLQQVQGYFQSEGPDRRSPDGFREVLVLERQRQFICCFRGTTAEQQGKFDRQPNTVKLADNGGVSVFADRYRATIEFEPKLFVFLDQLMEENPFCDFIFCGHGFGAAMATIAAYRYAWGRPELRVAALVSGSAKAGLSDFRRSAHSLGNLKVARLELGYVRPLTQSGVHTGHTFRMNLSKPNAPVRAYRFADTKPDPSLMRKLRLNREKTIDEYVNALEDLGETWVKDFHRYDGTGVKGQDNELRWVV